MVAILVVLTVFMFLTVDYVMKRRRVAAPALEAGAARTAARFRHINDYRAPLGVFFDPGHSWVYLEESGTAKVGIDEFAQSLVGDIDRIDARLPGDRVRKGDVFIKLHHGDRTAALHAPFDGVIEEVNHNALACRELLDVEPYTDAWLYKMRPIDTTEIPKKMHFGDEAKAWLKHEVERLKVFLATTAPEHPVLGQTMQDGGLPCYGLVDHLDDVAWNTLQSRFFV